MTRFAGKAIRLGVPRRRWLLASTSDWEASLVAAIVSTSLDMPAFEVLVQMDSPVVSALVRIDVDRPGISLEVPQNAE